MRRRLNSYMEMRKNGTPISNLSEKECTLYAYYVFLLTKNLNNFEIIDEKDVFSFIEKLSKKLKLNNVFSKVLCELIEQLNLKNQFKHITRRKTV